MMSHVLPLTGTALLLALTSALGLQVRDSLSNPPQMPPIKVKPVSVPVRSAAVVDDNRPERDDTYFAAITQRPLFDPSRQPALLEAAQAPAVPIVAPPAPALPPSPPTMTVLGVIGIGDASKALLAPDGAEPEWVKLGDQLTGWTLIEIGPDWVVLSKSEQQFRLDMYQ